jgi:glycosyltransferase involved in cell wall biosynthesis
MAWCQAGSGVGRSCFDEIVGLDGVDFCEKHSAMHLVFLQRLDQAGGGSRASMRGTMKALRSERPAWELSLVSQECGPVGREMIGLGVNHLTAPLARFRKFWERPAFWRDCRSLASKLVERAPDAILSNEWVTAPHAFQIARQLGIPAFSYVRDFAAVARGRKYQLHRMDRLLCVCETMRRELIAVGYEAEKVLTVYNPIQQAMPSEPEAEVFERIQQMRDVDRYLLYLGRISPRKNQLAAIATLKLLREQTGERWGLILAGDEDEEYAAGIDAAARSAGLENAVARVGLVKNPGCLFGLADASILTSKSEGLARVLIESFLCGKPAFSYPLGGLEDVYGAEIERFVADERKPEALVARILQAFANPDELQDRTAALRRMFEVRHSLGKHVEAFEQAVRVE